ncbi:MAG: protein translocase subunit SecF, partial [Bacteroidales bacterium]|nr:protein translocase subunit SecF [Bacteroidales bacterium]
AIADGYKNAYSAIIDGNVTTILTGIILYIFGSGPVQGFATTLIIGIICSLFTAIFISRFIFTYWLDHNRNITFDNKVTRNVLTKVNFDFIGKRKKMYLVSGIAVVIVVASFFVRGMSYGVDFSGGRSYVVRFDQSVNSVDVRSELAKQFGEAPEVKTFGSANQVKVTSKYMITDDTPQADSIVEARLFDGVKGFYKETITFEDFTADDEAKVLGRLSSQKIGPTIAQDIKVGAVLAVLFSLLVIFIYIAIRFNKWQYGVGGLVSLAFVTIMVIGAYSLFHNVLPFSMEVDQVFIAAVLTIIGYAINDTVIVFDRIRENMHLFPKRDNKTNMNTAVNATLSRTLNTSGTTLAVLLVIFLFGGEVIRGFAFALLLGVAIGTYSSIFTATPIAYDLMNRKKKQEENK